MSTSMGTATNENTNNDGDTNTSDSDNEIKNTGNDVTINNNTGRKKRSLRSFLDSLLDPPAKSSKHHYKDFLDMFLRKHKQPLGEVENMDKDLKEVPGGEAAEDMTQFVTDG